jgi:3D (Asp-Asp-Asp) domain-containing protein
MFLNAERHRHANEDAEDSAVCCNATGNACNRNGPRDGSELRASREAATKSTLRDNTTLPVGTIVYVPHHKKYLIVEDDWSCDLDEWIDV